MICALFEIFLPTPSARRATAGKHTVLHPPMISTHALREEGDIGKESWGIRYQNFYPRPPRGGRPDLLRLCSILSIFLPTPSARRATWPAGGVQYRCEISTHALREEGDSLCGMFTLRNHISTHALREEGDPTMPDTCATACYFYPRPPRGGRPGLRTVFANLSIFLPTPSARRATTLFRWEAKT